MEFEVLGYTGFVPFFEQKLQGLFKDFHVVPFVVTYNLYVTTNGTTSLEALGLVCNALVREILAARRNCYSRKL